jgi:hypothetical protein
MAWSFQAIAMVIQWSMYGLSIFILLMTFPFMLMASHQRQLPRRIQKQLPAKIEIAEFEVIDES